MNQLGHIGVGFSGFRSSVVVAQGNPAPISLDDCMPEPARLVEIDSSESRGVTSIRIHDILAISSKPQIRQAIVVSDHVDMVDLIWRPFSVGIKPDHSMSQDLLIEDAKQDVAVLPLCASAFEGPFVVPARTPTGQMFVTPPPSEKAGLWLIAQEPSSFGSGQLTYSSFNHSFQHKATVNTMQGNC